MFFFLAGQLAVAFPCDRGSKAVSGGMEEAASCRRKG